MRKDGNSSIRYRITAAALALALLAGDILPFSVNLGSVRAQEAVQESALSENTLSAPESADRSAEEMHIGRTTDIEKEDYRDEAEEKDLPFYLEENTPVRVFVYFGKEQEKSGKRAGRVTWSILRGEQGAEHGTVNLTGQEDDWTAFEEVESAPGFTLQEESDPESAFYGTAILTGHTPDEAAAGEYLLRASLWYGEEEKPAAMTTVSVFAPEATNGAATEENAAQEDPEQGEAGPGQSAQENELQKGTEQGEADPEQGAEENGLQKDAGQSEADPEQTSEEDNKPEEIAGQGTFTGEDGQSREANEEGSVSENSIAETGEEQPDSIKLSKLTLNRSAVTMNPGESLKLKATATPEGLDPVITWSSSAEQVAVVDAEGLVQAVGEGTALIFAESGEKRASAEITVVLSDAEQNQDQPVDEEGNLLSITDEIWIAGFERESDALTYTGGRITQNIRVYHKGKILEEKKDYVLTYKNQVNAAAFNTAKAPSVTVTMKGQYAGSRTFYYTIAPRQIDEEQTMGYEQAVAYAGKLKIPTPVLYYGKKRLAVNKDFVCDYSTLPEKYNEGASYEEGKTYEYTVRGVGNFTGTLEMRLAVVKDKNRNLENAAVTLDQKKYSYHGSALTQDDVQITAVKVGKTILERELYDYAVCASAPGQGYVEIFPSEKGRQEGYRGRKRVTIQVTGDRRIQAAELGEAWQQSIVFSGAVKSRDGGMRQEKSGVLVYQSGTDTELLTEGVDYTVTYSGHQKVGKATVVFRGIGRYTGTLKKSYQILPNTDLRIIWLETDENGQPRTSYRKGGARAKLKVTEVSDNGESYVLSDKTDYRITYQNNRNIGTMVCQIRGTGNYKGFQDTAEVEITAADISEGTMTVLDKKYSAKANAWKSPVTIMDAYGQKLKAGTDYAKELTYRYEGIETGQAPEADTRVYVTAQGINGYAGSEITGSYRIFQTDIKNLVIVVDPKEYTGKEVELTQADIHVYASAKDKKAGREIEEDVYEICGYRNNSKVGKATVILRGIGGYGGVRNCTFSIQKKKYQSVSVEKVLLDETQIVLGLGKSRQLQASVWPENAQNKTLLWSSSNSKIVTVDAEGNLTAQKAGKVTIQAKSQDSGKKAVCKVTVAVIPVTSFKLNTDKIQQTEGTAYQLQVQEIRPEDATESTIVWESSHEEAASVDQTGNVSLNSPGMAVIKARTPDGSVEQKCLVIVDARDEKGIDGTYLTPQMFRTAGQMDDTQAFQDAVDHLTGECDTFYVPAGTYLVDAVTGIRLKSQMNLIMAEGAVLQAVGNSSRNYHVLLASSVSQVKISGGQIRGERYEHDGSSGGEWGMGIGIYDSKNVQVTGTTVTDCWGDGIYLGSTHEADQTGGCRDITIQNCELSGNRRNNLSIVCADDVTVEGCTFRNARGTSPEYGIDIETNISANPCERIRIKDSLFEGNGQAAIGIVNNADDVRVEGCTLKGAFINYAGTNVVLADTVVYGETDARIGIRTEGNTRLNDGSEEEDVLVASFDAADWDAEVYPYGVDAENAVNWQLTETQSASSGKALRLERTTKGTKEAGCRLKLSDLKGGKKTLQKGVTYRFEYVIRGEGQWGIKTNQTGWYPILPVQDKWATGIVTYRAGAASSCELLLYAVDKSKGMWMEIESIRIYEVR